MQERRPGWPSVDEKSGHAAQAASEFSAAEKESMGQVAHCVFDVSVHAPPGATDVPEGQRAHAVHGVAGSALHADCVVAL